MSESRWYHPSYSAKRRALTGVFCAGSQTTSGKIFNPSFPATCPYVTAVGATQVSPGKTVFDPESACEETIHSGGGFSNYFATPDYQRDAVSGYLKHSRPSYPSDIWNSTGKVGWILCPFDSLMIDIEPFSPADTLISLQTVPTT